VPLDGLHGERDRAESFGWAAEQYDRYRPGYPSALIDELLAPRPARALDVGCGTGKVAIELMRRGVPVLGIEPDSRMADVARRIASFESWEPAGRTYDLLTAGHAWHWVHPEIGMTKAASITVSGGTVALFWNYHVVDGPLVSLFEEAYRLHAPELAVVGGNPSAGGARDADPFEGNPDFASFGSRTFRWARDLNADEWTSMLGTFSDHAHLGAPRLRDLQRAIRQAIVQAAGGSVRSRVGTYVWMARRL
jgi:SAM-dependent methyltransferase